MRHARLNCEKLKVVIEMDMIPVPMTGANHNTGSSNNPRDGHYKP